MESIGFRILDLGFGDAVSRGLKLMLGVGVSGVMGFFYKSCMTQN